MTTITATQVHRVFIKAPPERIWAAITEPAFTRDYFYGVSVETSGRPGDPFRHRAPDGTLLIDETVLEAEPPQRLVVSWRPLYDPACATEPASRVTFAIDGRDDGVSLLTVIHDELEDSPHTADHVAGEGWARVLSGLKTLLETGRPL